MNTAKIYLDSEENECSIIQMVEREPIWAANRVQEGEKALERLEKLELALEKIAAYPATRDDELGSAGCRKIARVALSA